MIILKKKTEVLKIVRVFDRVDNSIDPWNSTVSAPSLAESMHRTADDNSYLPSTVSLSSTSSSSSTYSTPTTSGSNTAPSSTSTGTMSATVSTNTQGQTTPTTTTTTATTTVLTGGLTSQTSTPKADVTPYNQFLSKIFYPNPLERSEATGLYKEARDLMAKFDKAFIILILALLVLHFFKRVD